MSQAKWLANIGRRRSWRPSLAALLLGLRSRLARMPYRASSLPSAGTPCTKNSMERTTFWITRRSSGRLHPVWPSWRGRGPLRIQFLEPSLSGKVEGTEPLRGLASHVADRVVFVGPQSGHVNKPSPRRATKQALSEFQTAYATTVFLEQDALAGELILIEVSRVDHLE